MEDIIAPINKEVLKSELTEDKRLRFTNKSHNEIYIVTWKNAPNVLKEIGRLREIAFRAAGGGTGKALDLDEYDLWKNPYHQLIVWNPDAEENFRGDIGIYWEMKLNLMHRVSLYWLRHTCLISQKSF